MKRYVWITLVIVMRVSFPFLRHSDDRGNAARSHNRARDGGKPDTMQSHSIKSKKDKYDETTHTNTHNFTHAFRYPTGRL